MTAEWIMAGIGLGYGLAALAYVREGQPWMAATLLLYAVSIFTIYRAGTQ